jgi:acyl-CoA thioesterase-1
VLCLALWGDSIGRAVGYNESIGRYAVLKPNYREMLLEGRVLNILNHARFGATLPEGIKDFEETPEVDAPVVAIQYGGNDCNFNWPDVAGNLDKPHQPVTPLPLFEEGLRRFIRLVKSRGKIPLLITPPPLEAQRFFDWVTRGLDSQAVMRFLGDIQRIYRWQERYAIAIQRVARLARCRLFDLRDAFLASEDMPSYLCRDGMHPNEKGQLLIARAIKEALPRLGLS